MGDTKGVGLDIGTNMLVTAMLDEQGNVFYKKQRDAFYRRTPKSKVNAKSIKKVLMDKKSNFIMEGDDFILVGDEALLMANERSDNVNRPMSKGVLSPKERDSLPMIKLLIKSLIDDGPKGSELVFSIPAEPIDGSFDIFFHTEMMKTYIREMGYEPTPLNEGFAVAFAELLNDNLTGMCISFGAGMVNSTVCYEGEPVVEFSITRGGDWIDQAVAHNMNDTASSIQIEKEDGDLDLLNPDGKIQEAISVYYSVLMEYALKNITYELERVKLPAFREPISVVVSGGLTLANGFVDRFKESMKGKAFPFDIKEVRRAADPMTAVAHGCLMASIL